MMMLSVKQHGRPKVLGVNFGVSMLSVVQRVRPKVLGVRFWVSLYVVANVLATILAKHAYSKAKLIWLLKRLVGATFNMYSPVRTPLVISGPGSTKQIGQVIRNMGCKRPLVVTDEMLVKFGIAARCIGSIDQEGLQHTLYDGVVPDPHSELVEEGYELYKRDGCDSIIAIGGGSPMDVAKVIGAKVVNPKPVKDYQGFFKVNMFSFKSLPPFIAVPTTAGTGSETTMGAVITLRDENAKITIGDFGLVPNVAVLDPEIVVNLPKALTAATGMDALTHAIEAYMSGWQGPYSKKCSTSATAKIFQDLAKSFNDGSDLCARESMLKASFEAGLAITRANVGYVHAIAHQIGAMFHMAHGEANAMLLPHVLGFYIHDESQSWCHCTNLLCQLAEAANLKEHYDVGSFECKHAVAREFVARIAELNELFSLPSVVEQMKAEHVEEIATRALKEAHGETFPITSLAALVDSGYPVPRYMTHDECKCIVAKVLPPGEHALWIQSVKQPR